MVDPALALLLFAGLMAPLTVLARRGYGPRRQDRGARRRPPAAAPRAPGAMTLHDARIGEPVRVVSLSRACQGPERRRLLDLGLVRGAEVTARFAAAAGDPVAYTIRGALIALRRRQASWITVERPTAEPAETPR